VFSKHHSISCINNVAFGINEEAHLIDRSILFVNFLARWIGMQDWLTPRIHFDVSQNTMDIKASERENLWEFSILQLIVQEKDLSLSCTDVAFFSYDVTMIVHHEASLVDSHILASFIFASQQLYFSITISVKDTHDFLNFKRLSCVCVKFWH